MIRPFFDRLPHRSFFLFFFPFVFRQMFPLFSARLDAPKQVLVDLLSSCRVPPVRGALSPTSFVLFLRRQAQTFNVSSPLQLLFFTSPLIDDRDWLGYLPL